MAEQHKAVTGRPNDLEIRQEKPVLPNSTMAERKRARLAASQKKAVQSAENKAVKAVEDEAVEAKKRAPAK